MKRYIEYYTDGAGSAKGELVLAMGSDSVVCFDQRYSNNTAIKLGLELAKQSWTKKHYRAFKITRGESLSDTTPITDFIMIPR
jgi:hypothetical protein